MGNNQIEFSPFSPKEAKSLVTWMQERGISVTAYGSLGHSGNDLLETRTEEMQQKYGKSKAQVLLRWALDKNIAVVPGATSEAHIRENLDVTDFRLTTAEIDALEAGSKPKKWKWFHAIPGK